MLPFICTLFTILCAADFGVVCFELAAAVVVVRRCFSSVEWLLLALVFAPLLLLLLLLSVCMLALLLPSVLVGGCDCDLLVGCGFGVCLLQ